jgi:hypothetical protein
MKPILKAARRKMLRVKIPVNLLHLLQLAAKVEAVTVRLKGWVKQRAHPTNNGSYGIITLIF